jgi:hypothetical protein
MMRCPVQEHAKFKIAFDSKIRFSDSCCKPATGALSVALDNSLSADKPIFKAILKKGYLAEKRTFELCLTPDITTLLIQPI